MEEMEKLEESFNEVCGHAKRLEILLTQSIKHIMALESDNHVFGSRKSGCNTCDRITTDFEFDFGCVKVNKKSSSKILLLNS